MSKILLAFLLLLLSQHGFSQEVKTSEEWISIYKRS